MKVEVLYIEECPNYELLMGRLRRCLERAAANVEPSLLLVGSDSQAASLRFLGSPTVRLDGLDIEPGSEVRQDYGLKCRLYLTPEGLRGLPPDELILAALARRR